VGVDEQEALEAGVAERADGHGQIVSSDGFGAVGDVVEGANKGPVFHGGALVPVVVAAERINKGEPCAVKGGHRGGHGALQRDLVGKSKERHTAAPKLSGDANSARLLHDGQSVVRPQPEPALGLKWEEGPEDGACVANLGLEGAIVAPLFPKRPPRPRRLVPHVVPICADNLSSCIHDGYPDQLRVRVEARLAEV